MKRWVVLALVCASTARAGTRLTAIHAGGHGLDLQFSHAPTSARIFALKEPPRWVFDASNTQSSLKTPWVVGHSGIRQLRMHNYRHKLRLVADLMPSCTLHHRWQGRHLILGATCSHPAPKALWVRRKLLTHTNHHRAIRVVIDPGHGGKDPGARGYHGLQEKDVVLKIGTMLGKRLNAIPGFEAHLTRTTDRYLTLRQRLGLARRYRADLFVAIHADAFHNHHAHGVSVFALSQRGATSEAARWLAEKENNSEFMGGAHLDWSQPVLSSVLMDLQQTATISASLTLGRYLLQDLTRLGGLHHDSVGQAAFVVLKSPDIPSLLIETGFITNRFDAKRLANSRDQKRLADAIAHGIMHYFHHFPPPGTSLSQAP